MKGNGGGIGPVGLGVLRPGMREFSLELSRLLYSIEGIRPFCAW